MTTLDKSVARIVDNSIWNSVYTFVYSPLDTVSFTARANVQSSIWRHVEGSVWQSVWLPIRYSTINFFIAHAHFE